MVGIIIFLHLVAAVIVLAIRSYRTVKPAHFAVPTAFDKPQSRVLLADKNPHWLPPWWETKPEYIWSMELQTLDLSFSFFTKDNREVMVDGRLRFIWNPYVRDKQGIPRVFYVTTDQLKLGLESKFGSEIGRLGGLYPWSMWRSQRREIENILNSILRLPAPPHVNPLDPEGLGKQLQKQEYRHLVRELPRFGSTPDSPEVPRNRRIPFYSKFSGPIGELLRSIPDEKSHSPDEQFYGIAIKDLTVHNVDFSEKTKEALEQAQRAKDEIRGAERRHRIKRKWAKELRDEDGLDPQSAQDSAELNMGQATKQIHSIAGLKKLIEINFGQREG